MSTYVLDRPSSVVNLAINDAYSTWQTKCIENTSAVKPGRDMISVDANEAYASTMENLYEECDPATGGNSEVKTAK